MNISEPTVVFINAKGKGDLWYKSQPKVKLSGDVGADKGTSYEMQDSQVVIKTTNKDLDGKMLVIEIDP